MQKDYTEVNLLLNESQQIMFCLTLIVLKHCSSYMVLLDLQTEYILNTWS